ncbi:fasciclin domain-containing protein [Acuticoccus sp. MNP-M23]|uniref:fasciclin domain-containing protein n=1 Tax=Acuticoccus sp. MNP-M23 TaxID=3072793 RepID=UPI002814A355|nr:fasciclin domain-containing protein [Acuticoccus sp. MNP-M23]WMS44622.1 fasciclin domain-containing protein [Acuticoccus sp. MNP-M23]
MNSHIRAATLGLAVLFSGSALAQDATIVATAQATPTLSTLVTAVSEAGLVDTLNSEGPFTVFAPTNDAFAALPDGALDGLLADKDALAGVLTYHVIGSEVMAADLIGMIEAGDDEVAVETVNGASFAAAFVDGGVQLTDGQGNTVNVVATDVAASNGVVHVIDGVLMP